MSSPSISLVFPWQREAFKQLTASGLHSSMLIHGPKGIGKQWLALMLAREHITSAAPAKFEDMFDSFNHPDFRLVAPVIDPEKKGERVIIIDDVRFLLEYCVISPKLAPLRIVVESPACRMNPASSNSLLKLLEEPPQKAALILSAYQPNRLPATVLSRCRKFSAPVPTREQSIVWLRSFGKTLASLLTTGNELEPKWQVSIRKKNDAEVYEETLTWLKSSWRTLESVESLDVSAIRQRLTREKFEWLRLALETLELLRSYIKDRKWLESANISPTFLLLDVYGNAPIDIVRVKDPELLEQLVEFLRHRRQPSIGDIVGKLDAAAKSGKSRPIEWMGLIVKWVSDIVATRFGADPIHFTSMRDDLVRISGKATHMQWLDLQAEFVKLHTASNAAITPLLLAERTLGEYAALSHRK